MNTKRRWETFSFYDRSGIARHLEAMAARGWMLEAIGPLGWKYRRCPPRQLRFAVTYYPKATVYDPAPTQEQEFFYDLCAHDGWILAASSGEMQVFFNDYPAPTPIETDPALEVETIHKLAWRRVLLPWGLILAVLLATALRVFMKRRGVDAEMTQGAVISVLLGVLWLLTAISPLLPLDALRGGTVQEWAHSAPLSTAEMLGREEGPWSFSEVQNSLLMERFRCKEPAFNGSHYTIYFSDLSYTVTIPRFAPLYGFSRAALLRAWGDGVRRHSEAIAPEPWGANEAYQCFDLYEREYKEYHYLIFYDQALVELELLEEVTPEQKALVGTRFQTLDS